MLLFRTYVLIIILPLFADYSNGNLELFPYFQCFQRFISPLTPGGLEVGVFSLVLDKSEFAGLFQSAAWITGATAWTASDNSRTALASLTARPRSCLTQLSTPPHHSGYPPGS